ncbi:hypothetical protein DB41_HG00180 [Neochlamydia sp. TUME1]|nr:hypothetical protein DB41_HG00180 [Neochlamydia sp. TUME1]
MDFLASPHNALKHFIKKKPDKADRLKVFLIAGHSYYALM